MPKHQASRSALACFLVVLLQDTLLKAVALQCVSGTWSGALQSCVLEGVLSSRRAVGYVLATPEQLGPNDILKVHVRGVGPRLTASLLVGRSRRNSTAEYRRIDASELVFGLAAAEVAGANNVTVYLENYSLLGLQFTLVAHVHRPDALLAAREARLLAELGAQCCRPRSTGLWCMRLNALSAALANARPGHSSGAARTPDVCSFPEVLCSQQPAAGAAGGGSSSLLKLWMPSALDCDGSWSGLVGLAGAPSLAWLDVSLSTLEFPLSALSPLLGAPALTHVVLTDAGLTGPLSYGNNNSSSSGSGTSNSGSAADGSGGGGGGGGAQPATCEGLAPAGRRLLALSGNRLTGPVPGCLAAHPGLVELQLAMNLALTTLPDDWSGAASLRHLDVSGSPSLRGPLTALPPALVHLNASGTSLGGGIPPLPPTLYTLDLLEAGLVGGIAGAAAAAPPPPSVPVLAASVLEPTSLTGGSAGGSGSGSGAGDGGGGDAEAGAGAGAGTGAGSMRGWLDCVNLTYVDVGSNVLRGGVPDLPRSVLVLYLDNNALSGPLPSSLPPGLIILNASANALSGSLPRTQLDSLRFLDLSRNRFSGGLPSSLAGSSQLIYLNASFNNISGTLVLFAFKLRSTPNSLQVLDLSHNSLVGSVPSYLSQLAVFSVQGALPSFPRVLDLSYNRLSGAVPDFVFRLLPPVVWSCRCLLLLALGGGGNQLACPTNAPSLDSTSLNILWLYQVSCVDGQTNITYSLAQWLTPGFQRLTLPDASAGDDASAGGSSSGSSSSSTTNGGSSGRTPGEASAAADADGYCDGSDPVAAASALCTYGPNPFARPGQGSVPDALKGYSWQQVLSMAATPAGAGGNTLPIQLSSSSSGSDTPWPLANILTIVLAALTASIVLLIVTYLCVRSWVVRRERARRRARRREIRAARMAGQRQALWADRMAQMEREAAAQDQGAVQQAAALAAAEAADADAAADRATAAATAAAGADDSGVVVTATGSRPHVGAVELQLRHAKAPAGAAAAALTVPDAAGAAASASAPDAAGSGGAGAASVGASAQQLRAHGAAQVQVRAQEAHDAASSSGSAAQGGAPGVVSGGEPWTQQRAGLERVAATAGGGPHDMLRSEDVVLQMSSEADMAAATAGTAVREAEAPPTAAKPGASAGHVGATAEAEAGVAGVQAAQDQGQGNA
ncbi:hypothetical protein HYH02_005352 [Chlamydomonas schloesseri]|uniref:Uncharacterized protein n=1 Tax=Chlamydomonas schloesseri TaxID=2026947 RepID=A0A836B7W7_9CHLO|nr:hypothetical protein HYH02_005352 [Chlamydomonas schloesseri]|eukprot:KAG2449829.1 hypothetical protein HYH02_005352 [Chlamydomonas schloesseri]